MSIIKKELNGTKIELDSSIFKDYLGCYIKLSNKTTTLSAYEVILKEKSVNAYKPPVGTKGLLKLRGDKVQPIGVATVNLIKEALKEFNELPEIKLPKIRNQLVSNIEIAYDKNEYQREQDYQNDIGFLLSSDKEIKKAEQALIDFDNKNPEFAKEIAKAEALKTEQQIKSALNA